MSKGITKFCYVDVVALTNAITKKNMTLKSASLEIGHAGDYLTTGLRQYDPPKIPLHAVLGIEAACGIPRSSFVIEKPSTPPVRQTVIQDSDTLQNMYKELIELKDGQTVLIEQLARLGETIYDAVDKAWKQ